MKAVVSPPSPSFPEPVRAAVAPLLTGGAPGAVAFDADGTLWRGDIGEELLRLLAAEGRVPGWPRPGVYAEYERRVERDPADAYAFAVEVMAGLEEPALEAACETLYERRFAGRLFPWVRPLLRALAEAGHAVWVVSASPVWSVRPGARALGVDASRVIGVTCPVEGARLLGGVSRPVPCGEGKVQRLQAAGVRPLLAVGNGDLDLPMLAYAEAALVVAPFGGPDNALVAEALRRRWPVVRA